jgi:hypothetical protein
MRKLLTCIDGFNVNVSLGEPPNTKDTKAKLPCHSLDCMCNLIYAPVIPWHQDMNNVHFEHSGSQNTGEDEYTARALNVNILVCLL